MKRYAANYQFGVGWSVIDNRTLQRVITYGGVGDEMRVRAEEGAERLNIFLEVAERTAPKKPS